ncbi:MAG TPA: metalloprotease, partial [Bacteroidales bacterium]|nr:metalloprotease [Bacteroidales bacterium]
MKRKLLSALLLMLSLSVIAQERTFKPVTKKQGNNPSLSARYRTINGNDSKSGEGSKSNFPGDIRFPEFKRNFSDVKKIISRNNSPVYIERNVSGQKSSAGLSFEERFYSFFDEMKVKTRISSPGESFTISDIRTDEFGITHINAIQTYKGIKIYGSETSLHLSPGKERFAGRLHTCRGEINTKPENSAEEILTLVVRDIKKITRYREMRETEKEILKYESPSCSLVILNLEDNLYTLAYEVEIRPNFIERWRYFVDAGTGKILRKYNITNSEGPATASAIDLNGVTRILDTYQEGGSYYLVNAAENMYNPTTGEGVVVTLNANNTSTTTLDYDYVSSATNIWNNATAVSAHYNATRTYKYFYNTFGRYSINGNKGNIISLINVAEEDGSSMENAFWNGQAVFYGNGGAHFKPLAGALDVTAHELGHGIVSNTANLEYYGQSGAINESYADIFGSMVDRDDWLIGEDIVNPAYYPSGALRNMADPHNGGTSINDHYWQPRHTSEMYIGEEDNGGVHINNGIGSHAYYLFATAVTKEIAEQVFYRALTTYLKSTSQFIDFRIAVIQAATDLYGTTAPPVAEKAAEAFEAVGIYEEEQIDYAQDYKTNPGVDFLLSYDTNTSDPATLYRSSTSGTDFIDLTTTAMKGKVSVSDDGTVAAFVSTGSYIKAINLNPANTNERDISTYAEWDNVAISKDGNRLAAISTEVDTAIYVFDLQSDPIRGVKYHLYNPTTSHTNTNAGGVLYADAIEFDNTGENLIYDAYNVLNSNTTKDINYWDIGFINVWNNNLKNFGTGEIKKLYGSLPENVSIGNPVFSKNSPYIIAFDYFDSYNDEYAILGANLLTGDLDIITGNTIIGYPCYSKEDNKVAYSTMYYSDNVVAVINLGADKISGTGSPALLVEDAKWPVFYSTGV